MAILDYGLFEVYANGRRIGIPGYFIETGKRRILVDTGFHRDYLADPLGVCEADGLGAFGRLIDYRADQNPHAQLKMLGIRPRQITDLILTHGHVDHVGRIDEFPAARLWVSANEGILPQPYYWDGRSRIGWPPLVTTLVYSETDIAPGVTVIPTPGHTHGHLSLHIDLPVMGPTILTADAISRPDEAADGVFGDADDPVAARNSARVLHERAAATQAWVIYGHCPQQWQSLRKAPFFYC